MKILVTTPGGRIGRQVLWDLLAPEFDVRVITRDPARLADEVAGQVEVVRGSTDDAATLARALEGVEAMFWCVPPESIQEKNVRGHYERFARAASEAIRKARTPRVVTISAVGKGLARDAGPISGLHAMEDIVNDSGAAVRHVRCGSIMDNLLRQWPQIRDQGTFSYPLRGDLPIPMVAISDIADCALGLLVRRNWGGVEAVPVHGPADVSWHQAAAMLEWVLERPVNYEEASPEEFAETLAARGASTEYAQGLLGMFAELAEGIFRAEPRTIASTTRTTLSAWAGRELLPLARASSSYSEPQAACACGCEV